MKRLATSFAAVLAVLSLMMLTPASREAAAQTNDGCAGFPAGKLTHWWPGDGNGDDIIGGRHGVLQGDTTFGPGLIGQAFVLDGDEDWISVSDHSSLDVGTADFSFELWVMFDSVDPALGLQIFAQKWVDTDPENLGWTFGKQPDNSLSLFTGGGGGYPTNGGIATKPLDIRAGEWIHFAGVRRGDRINVYMNGDYVDGAAYPAEVPNLDNARPLKIGGTGDAFERYVDGMIDEVGYYVGYALTDEEIRDIYQAGSKGKCIDSFTDDDGNTFESDIEWLAAEGITRGCDPPVNDLFCPDDFVTRGQMAAFLHRALDNVLSPSQQVEFIDDDGNTFEADIEWLGGTGVTKGCNPPTNNRYCPDDFVTRGQMAAFLVRALGYTDDGGGDLFIDDDGNTFENDIDKLGTAGVTKGCNPPTNTEFCPNDFVTRGQMAAFLNRALGS